MVLSQINEQKLRTALSRTALMYLEKHPLDKEHAAHGVVGDWLHKISDLFEFNNIALVMCRINKMAQDESVDKRALAVAAGILFQHYRTEHAVTFHMLQEFLDNNPFENDLLEIAAKIYVQQEHMASRHKFHVYDPDVPSVNHYYYAFLALFTIAAEENSHAFDAAVVDYLRSSNIENKLNLPH
jgi:hypothetical protein